MADDDDRGLASEALRVYRRYAVEVVEHFGLCPWAERARLEGRVRECVLLDREADPTGALEKIAELARDERVEVGLLILPCLGLERLAFEHFVSRIRDLDMRARELGGVPFAMAAFHPAAEPALGDPEKLIPFLRRTPDPTIQLVRRSVLERVQARAPHGTSFVDVRSIEAQALLLVAEEVPIRERIAAANLATVNRVGVAALECVFADILRDREQAYACCRDSQSG